MKLGDVPVGKTVRLFIEEHNYYVTGTVKSQNFEDRYLGIVTYFEVLGVSKCSSGGYFKTREVELITEKQVKKTIFGTVTVWC